MAHPVLRAFRQAGFLAISISSSLFTSHAGADGAFAQVPTAGATAEVRDASNRVLATATFREGRNEVLINIQFPTPPLLSGSHAIHINDTGRCDPPDFSTSGNIFNPFNKPHGRQNPAGAEVGDLPNINLSTGLTSYNTTASGATLGAGAASLLSPPRSVVIFTGEDDQTTAPEGNAGTRLGCGVIAAGAATGAAPVAAGAPAAPGAPVGGVTPTPTPATSARIASPVPVQGQAQAPQAAQPVPAQGQAGQPARPANSPVVVPKPVVVNNNAAPSPVVAAPVPAGQQVASPVPTPFVQPTVSPLVAAAPATTQGSTGNNFTALIIAVLGVGLVGVGYLLRRRRQLQQ